MASMNTSALACNYAISGVGGLKLSSPKPSSLSLGVTKRLSKINAQAHNSTEDLVEVDKIRRASLFGLGAALVTSPFSSSAIAEIMETAAEKDVIKVVGFSGSLSKKSHNRDLLREAIKICKEYVPGMLIEEVNISTLPIINPDQAAGGKFPPEVEKVRQKIHEADAILFATPEYNYAVTPLLKNVLDWGSMEPNVWDDKPAAMMSAGYEVGGGLSQFNLRQIGVRPNIHFINQPQLFVRLGKKKSDKDDMTDPDTRKTSDKNDMIDEDTRKTIKEILFALKKFTKRLKHID